MKFHVLYNPYAGNNTGRKETEALNALLPDDELIFCDMTSLSGYEAFFAEIPPEDGIIISGGDGTLNRFVNDTDGLSIKNSIYYFAAGSGNDFLRDLGKEKGSITRIDGYLRDLPVATVKGRSYRVLNGVGYGIDGYCCEVGDELRRIPGKKINYTAIAIKGLLFHFKPKNATVTVDGVTQSFRKVWLAPTMNGRFYGGGMIPTPEQDRLASPKTLSTLIYHNCGPLRALILFPSIFKGEHVKNPKLCRIITGKEITVRFDRPCALQVDGETVLDVTEYTVRA